MTRTLTLKGVFPPIGVTISQGAAGTTVIVQSSAVVVVLLVTATVCATGSWAAPIVYVKARDAGVADSEGKV